MWHNITFFLSGAVYVVENSISECYNPSYHVSLIICVKRSIQYRKQHFYFFCRELILNMKWDITTHAVMFRADCSAGRTSMIYKIYKSAPSNNSGYACLSLWVSCFLQWTYTKVYVFGPWTFLWLSYRRFQRAAVTQRWATRALAAVSICLYSCLDPLLLNT